MTKPPAFQFYAQDFMVGSRTMTLAERGAYITLLCHQWDKLSVPGEDVGALSEILGCTVTTARQIWDRIARKFPKNSKGVFLNQRLEFERRKQKRYRKSQSNKGKLSAKHRQPRFNRGSTGVQPLRVNLSSSSSSSDVQEIPPTPPAPRRGSRRRASTLVTQSELDHVQKSQAVKRFLAEGFSRAEALAKAGYR